MLRHVYQLVYVTDGEEINNENEKVSIEMETHRHSGCFHKKVDSYIVYKGEILCPTI